MSNLEKRINLYKSTIGQIDKLLEDTENQEARDSLILAKANVQKIFDKEVEDGLKFVVDKVNTVMDVVGEMFKPIFDNLKELFEVEDD